MRRNSPDPGSVQGLGLLLILFCLALLAGVVAATYVDTLLGLWQAAFRG